MYTKNDASGVSSKPPARSIRSISRWLILTTIIGSALSFVLLMGTTLSSSYQNSIRQSVDSHTIIAELLAVQVAGGLRWKKTDVVTAVFNASVAAVDGNALAMAQVYDMNDDLWMEHIPDSHSGSGVAPSSELIDAHVTTAETIGEFNDDSYTVAIPVRSGRNNDRIGSLITVWDFSEKKAAATGVLIKGIYLSAFFLFMLVAIQWWAVKRLVGKPLRAIYSQMAQLAAGDTQIEVVGRKRDDEIGAIAAAVEVFRQHALRTIELKKQQDKAEQEAETQRQFAEKAELENQEERNRQLEIQRSRADREAAAAMLLKQRIESLLCAVDAASHGDLNYPIEVGEDQDDLQKVAIALKNMLAELRSSFDQIGQRATQLTNSAHDLKSLGATISSVATESTSRTSYASETSVRVSASVDTVASATQQMTASIKQIALNASDATSVANRAVELAENTDVSIRQLADSSRGIGEVIKVINSIAEQTNLLALNATIEAARAGDAGKGFAVVANEVKELAKETANATEEIERRIASIQTDTGIAVQAIDDINKIVRQISETQEVIANSVEEQTSTTQEINRTILETSQGNDEINNVMEGVVAQSESARDSATNVEAAAAQLSEVAQSLEELLLKFQYRQAA